MAVVLMGGAQPDQEKFKREGAGKQPRGLFRTDNHSILGVYKILGYRVDPMGKLRLESKNRHAFIDQRNYGQILRQLRQALENAALSRTFLDLDPSETATEVRAAFMQVARSEGLPLRVRTVPGGRSLLLEFDAKSPTGGRIPAEESIRRILSCLKEAPQPLQKRQILMATGVSASSWNLRIRDLLSTGRVVRIGERRDSTYALAESAG
jgi:hypothetical protein